MIYFWDKFTLNYSTTGRKNMDREVQSIVFNFNDLVPHSFEHNGEELTGQVVGIDCKDMSDVNTMYFYIRVQRNSKNKTYKVHWHEVFPVSQRMV